MTLSAGLFVVSTSASPTPSQVSSAKLLYEGPEDDAPTESPEPRPVTPRALECGKPLRHELPPHSSVTWRMNGEAGNVLSLHYLDKTDNSDTLINLQLNDESLVQGRHGSSASEIQSFLLPQQATYSLTLASDGSGRIYEIALTCSSPQIVPSPSATESPIPEPTPIPKSAPLRSRAAELTATGDLMVYLLWQSVVDLDLHVIDPRGEEIYYENPRSLTGGILEYEANASCLTATTEPVESIFWKTDTAPSGKYEVIVDYYGDCDNEGAQDFLIGVWIEGALVQIVEGMIEPGNNQLVHEFSFD